MFQKRKTLAWVPKKIPRLLSDLYCSVLMKRLLSWREIVTRAVIYSPWLWEMNEIKPPEIWEITVSCGRDAFSPLRDQWLMTAIFMPCRTISVPFVPELNSAVGSAIQAWRKHALHDKLWSWLIFSTNSFVLPSVFIGKAFSEGERCCKQRPNVVVVMVDIVVDSRPLPTTPR